MKKFWKSVKIWQSYGHEFLAYFFGSPCSFILSNESIKFHKIFNDKIMWKMHCVSEKMLDF